MEDKIGFKLVGQKYQASSRSVSIDDFAVLHGTAMSLDKDALEGFKNHLVELYPQIEIKIREDTYFVLRFCHYLPEECIEAAKQYLMSNFPEQYAAHKTSKVVTNQNVEPLDSDREKGNAGYFI